MLHLRAARYRYPSGTEVGPVDLDVRPGELVLLTGPTGCGKSTLLRLAAGLVARHGHGEVGGEVAVGGADPAVLAPSARVRRVGFVSQDPGDQIATGALGDEIAFGLESAGWDGPAIEARIVEMLGVLGLPVEPERAPSALSGGQRQRLVVASALAGGAGLLLLDEPLAWLDPAGAAQLLERLRALAERERLAILMVEHRLEPCLPLVHRVVVMEAGAVAWDGPAVEVPVALLRRLGLSVPGLADLDDRLAAQGRTRADVRPPASSVEARAPGGEPLIRAERLRFSWGGPQVLNDVQFEIWPGERVALLGANGAGKSTLLAALAGHLDAGPVRRVGRVIDVPQDPDLALFCETVAEELRYGPVEARARDAEAEARAAARALSVEDLWERPPQALSRGQRLRVAVAAALAAAPAVLCLDEPTSGQDRDQVERLMRALDHADRAVIFATHDVDLALRHATRWVVLDAGRVVLDGPPVACLAALPPDLPLVCPPLARWCLERGLPPATAEEVASWG